MAKTPMEDELLKLAAEQHGVPLALLTALLELEGEFGNLTATGAKGEFARQVLRILDESSSGRLLNG